MKKRIWKPILALLLLACLLCVSVLAGAASKKKDTKKQVDAAESGRGSFTVQFIHDGVAEDRFDINEVKMLAYKIADGNFGEWTMDPNFADIEVFVRSDGTANIDVSMQQLAARIDEKGILPDGSASGSASFGELPYGVYYIRVVEKPKYLEMKDMLLSIPKEGGSTNYDAFAKYSYVEPTPTPTPTPTPQPTYTPFLTPVNTLSPTPAQTSAPPTPTPAATPTPTPVPNTLTIHYILITDGTPVFDDYYQDNLFPGTPYDVPTPTDPRYKIYENVLRIFGTMEDRDEEFTVFYFPPELKDWTPTIFNDYDTPLGVGYVQMHVGVCFE